MHSPSGEQTVLRKIMQSLPQLTPVMGKGPLEWEHQTKLNQTTHYTLSTLSVALLLNYDHVKVIPEYWFNTISQKKRNTEC